MTKRKKNRAESKMKQRMKIEEEYNNKETKNEKKGIRASSVENRVFKIRFIGSYRSYLIVLIKTTYR